MRAEQPKMFSDALMTKIRDKFWFIDQDPIDGKRLFFENAGGSLRLKDVTEKDQIIISLPDCASRTNTTARWLGDIVEKGKEDFRLLVGAKTGDIVTSLTASRVLFHITGAIIANAPGTNVVTTRLEHPASYDSVYYYAEKAGKEVRVAQMNPHTGSIDLEEVLSKIDRDTSLLSFIYASNLTGAVHDAKKIIKEARSINPDIFILIDAVQHLPHDSVDVEELGVDGLVAAPYKMFGKRGFGVGYISDRVACLPHEGILGKKKDCWSVGSADPSGFSSISCVTDYICWLGKECGAGVTRREQLLEGMARIKAHENALLQRLLYGVDGCITGIKNMEGVSVHCVPDKPTERDLILAINIANHDAANVTKKYSERGIIVFERVDTSPFSKRILNDLGLPGIVRVSPMHYNTPNEIDYFLNVTAEIASQP